MKTELDFEREAWARGDYTLAALYGRIIELQKALGEALADNEELQTLLNRHAALDRIERVLQ